MDHAPPIGRPAHEASERRVTPVELFFDLVFVLAVTEVSGLLEDDHTLGGILRALVVFVPVYWLWVGTAIQTNQRDPAELSMRLTVLVIALTAVFMALALPRAFTDLGLLYALAYWAGRGTLGVGVLRSSRARFPINPVTVSIALTGPMLLAGALVDGDARTLLWGLAGVIDLASPTLLRTRLAGMHFDAGHLAERFSLFVLIALGESVVAIGASLQGEATIGATAILAVAAAFVLSCGVWWVYFHFSADMIGHSLATAAVQLKITRMVLSYGHLLFIAGIVGLSAGMHEAVAHPSEDLGGGAAGLLFGGTALFLATFGMTRWAMRRMVSPVRLGTAALLLVLVPLGATLPALMALVIVAALLVAVNVIELLQVARLPSQRRPWSAPAGGLGGLAAHPPGDDMAVDVGESPPADREGGGRDEVGGLAP